MKNNQTEFEEVEVNCKICGKKIKFVRRKGRTSESLVCQKCGKQ